MFEYIRVPSKKKPLHELDSEPYFSEHHPRGDALKELLQASKRSNDVRRAKAAEGNPKAGKRQRCPSIFETVKEQGLRSVEALQAYAAKQAEAGCPALAEYCTRNGRKLEDLIEHACEVIEAPLRLTSSRPSLLEKLAQSATTLPCLCNGAWIPGAIRILQNSNISQQDFGIAVCRALFFGAKRGVHVACVGIGGCGKSTLLEPLELIFESVAKPEGGSTFPLEPILSCDIFLWQDYEHDEKTVRFTDLLSLLVNESVGVRRPGAKNKKHKNDAPCFVSGRTPILCGRRDKKTAETLDSMMDERFTTFHFTEPLPKHERRVDWKHCGRCCAEFYSRFASSPQVRVVAAERPQQTNAPPANPTQNGFVQQLCQLAELYRAGVLNADELSKAKQKLLA